MRVLFLSYEWPPIGGGGGRAAERIAIRLARRGHAVTALTSMLPGLASEEVKDGVNIRRIRVQRRNADECTLSELFSFTYHSIPATRRLVREMRPDVLCAFFGIPGGPAAWWARKRDKVPYVLALRGSDVPRPELARHQRMHLFTQPLLRRFYRGAAGITAVSDALRAAALKVVPGVEIEVIPNGVDTEWYAPRRTEQPARDRANLLYVGRLREFKRVQDVIEALPLIHERLARPVRLMIAGSGPFGGELKAMAARAREISPAVEVSFAGWLDKELLRDAYEAADVVLLPSLVEGSPNVLFEAMAMGRPCVASDVPGTRESFENGREGLFVPPCRPDEIADAVYRILSTPETWREFARNARIRAEASSWERVTEQYEALLARAMAAR